MGFFPFKFHHFLVKVRKSCLQEGGKYQGGGITLYLLRRQTTSVTRHLLPFSSVDRRTFGLMVHQSIKTSPRSDKRHGALHIRVSQKHIEIKDCYCY